jgi:hypothetical protein
MTLRQDYDLSTVHGAVDFVLAEHFDLDMGGDPHSHHCLRVFARASARGASVPEQIAALLHDAVEDTPYTLDDLHSMGCPTESLRLIAALTHDPHVSDEDYYTLLVLVPRAAFVKDCDVDDNLDPVRMAYLPEPRRTRSMARKRWAKDFLAEHL